MDTVSRPSDVDSAPLVRANALFDAGDVHAAIAILEDACEASPSAAIETRLVEMRHHGFSKVDRAGGVETWPPRTSLIGPEGVIPEVQPQAFDADALRCGLLGHGAVIVRDMFPGNVVEQLRADIDASFGAFDEAMASRVFPEQASWFVKLDTTPETGSIEVERQWVRKASGVLAAEAPRALQHLIGAVKRQGIHEVIRDYFGETPALSVKKTTLRRVPFDTIGGWHQDGAFLGENIRTVNLWIALTDCGVDAPSMDMVPKRLPAIVPTGTANAPFPWAVDDDLAVEVSQPYAPVRLQFKAGDVIFFDEMNLHRTGMSPGMTVNRYAVEAWFFAPSRYPVKQGPILLG